jgi:hypothetical protein
LYYYGARYYASWIGRFCSVDPEKEQRTWVNPYNYVQNNPLNRTDPTGALDDDPPIQSNNGSKLSGNPHADEDLPQPKETIYDQIKEVNGTYVLGSVSFNDKKTMDIVTDAMKNDKVFEAKVMDLMDSPMNYIFKFGQEVNLLKGESSGGSLTMDSNTNVEINFNLITKSSGGKHKLTQLYHETEHAIQFEHGELGFVFDSNTNTWQSDPNYYDITDEIKAFDAHLSIPGSKDKHAEGFYKSKNIQDQAKFLVRKNPTYRDIKERHGVVEKSHKTTPNNMQYLRKTNSHVFFFKTNYSF